MPILEGLDGVQKMSKSLGNYIGITDSPDDMFGKIMSVSDDLMWRYFELLSFRSLEEIADFRRRVDAGDNPRDIKFELGMELVARFHSQAAAERARQNFVDRFQKGAIPDEIPECVLEGGATVAIATAMKACGLVQSTSEGFRMIKQGAVRIDGVRVEDRSLEIESGTTSIYQVGKRKFSRVSLT